MIFRKLGSTGNDFNGVEEHCQEAEENNSGI